MTLSKFLNPKNDVAFKKIFGTEKHKSILIRFINDILEFKGDNQIQEVEFLSTIQDPEIASKKQSIVDVLCKDGAGVSYIIEMQVAPTQGFEKRAQYYAAKAYSRQLNKGDERYDKLKEVIFIAIVDYVLFPDKTEYKSDHIILDKNTYEHDLKDFYFTFIELPKYKKSKDTKPDSSIEQWCRFFKYAEETTEQEFEQIIGSDAVIKEAYELINQFNWTEQELFAYEQEIKRVRDNKAVMDYFIENSLKKAAAEGMQKGMAKGMEKGMAKGMEKGKAEGIAQGMEKGMARGETKAKLEIAQAMLAQNIDINTIALITKLSPKEIEELKANK